MPVVNVVRQPKAVKNALTWYDLSGTAQTSTTANIPSKNGIRIEFTVEPDYSNVIRHFSSLVYEYSLDGSTWTEIPSGTGTPATVDSNDSGSNSERVITDSSGTKEIDQYTQAYAFDQNVQVRASITDSLGYEYYIDVLTYNITDINFDALNARNEDQFNTSIFIQADFNGFTLQNSEQFNTTINV
jgi:hypothetical protein